VPDVTDAGETRSPTPRWLLWVIVLAVPFVALAATEAGLRIAGFGHDREPLFIPSPGHPEYLQANPRVVTRFFTDPAQAPTVSIETAYFPATKAPGTFRVFVQGASSAAGFPYGLGASLAGVLDQRLERAFPGREIEVISTAMAAVNSYALLDFADEILARQPDAVVVYVGHNEFLGILGVGSTMRIAATPGLTRAFLAVRDWRLFQLMSRAYAGLRSGAPSPGPGDSLMARVAGERSIRINSDVYARGIEQFETNLFGTQELTNAVLPVMRAQGEGRIVQISSILGLVALAYRGAYSASKFALEALSDTMRLELRGTGIHVSLVEPGPIVSHFRENALAAFRAHIDLEHSAHRDLYRAVLNRLEGNAGRMPFTLPPEAVLKRVVHALESSRPKIRYPVTTPTYLFGYLRRLLPARWLDGIAYAAGDRPDKDKA